MKTYLENPACFIKFAEDTKLYVSLFPTEDKQELIKCSLTVTSSVAWKVERIQNNSAFYHRYFLKNDDDKEIWLKISLQEFNDHWDDVLFNMMPKLKLVW